MTDPDPARLRAALAGIRDPLTGQDLVTAGLVEGIQVRGGLVQATLRARREEAGKMEAVRQAAERALAQQPGVTNASVVLTAHRTEAPSPAPAPPPPSPHAGPAPAARLLPEVGAIVAVASGKGGVGKSTVAVNLAVALAAGGARVGLLDADIYGPSLPRMLGLARKPEVRGERLIPLDAWGLKAMSIGLLVEAETAMIWRGPMVMGALEQMMGQVEWGPLDIMVVDMPPGTGDAQLTMAQRVSLAGAVIVSTPQDIALIDARRGVTMFEKTHVPVLGLVENMSYFCCPNCNHRTEIFGHGGARAEAARLGVPFLGEIPLLADVRMSGDAGTPIAAGAPASEAGRAFAELARAVRERLAGGAAPPPRFVVS